MLKPHHIEICQRALGCAFGPGALNVVITANLKQDGLCDQIGHPEFHFDDNAFETSFVYMEEQRQIILDKLKYYTGPQINFERSDLANTWKAFGRLTHAAQDFYAHSNYISLWASTYHQSELPPPEEVPALQSDILRHSDLHSGKVYLADWLAFIPGLYGLARRFLPLDSHTHMNLDSPKQGPLFPYAIEAAVKRTIIEYEQIRKRLDSTALILFTDR